MARHISVCLLLAALLPSLIAVPQPPPAISDLFSTRQTIEVRPLATLLNETNTPPLSLSDKRAIISAAALILGTINPHLILYRTLYGANPISRLRAFSASLPFKPLSNVAFHEEMTSIFTEMRDRHTIYKTPIPLLNSFATLRVTVRVFFAPDTRKRRRYAVSTLDNGFKPVGTTFAAGVEILTWDDVPIDKVVRHLSKDSYGSNAQAQLDNGLQLLTLRSLAQDPIPRVPNVTVRFRDTAGDEDTFDIPWIFVQVTDLTRTRSLNRRFPRMAAEPTLSAHARLTFADAESKQVEIPGVPSVRVPAADRMPIAVSPGFEQLFSAEIITTTVGKIGRFVVPTFSTSITKELVNEISRILRLMPTTGLVMDLRGNTGGRAEYVKALVELITDKVLPEQPVILRASKFAQKLYNGDLKGATAQEKTIIVSYRPPVNTAVRAGQPFTGPAASLYSLAPPGRQQQVYKGPLVTVVDGLTYSAGDLFAALQVDQNISLLVGTSGNVGAGGASTVLYSSLARIAPERLSPLPGGADFSTALARFFRTGPNTGAVIEKFGVKPDIRYFPTFDDAVKSDRDLFEFLGEKLILRQPTTSSSPSPVAVSSSPSPPASSSSPIPASSLSSP